MENKNITIGVVRGIAIILVVYGHVIQRTMAPNGEDFFLNPVFKTIYTFHMPLFVFISGYLLAYSLSRSSVPEVLNSRYKRLFVPFIAWGILGIFTDYFLSLIDGKSIGNINFPLDLVNQLFLNPTIWFLFTLFILSCLLLFSIKLEKRFGKIIYAIIYFLILVIPLNDYCSLYYIKWFYLFYMIGYIINKYGMNLINKYNNAIVLVISSILFVLLASTWTKSDYIYLNKMGFESNQYFLEILRLLYRYFVAFLGILIAFYIGMHFSKTKMVYILDNIGIYSLDIYLIQRYVVEGIYPRFVNKSKINFDFNSPLFLCIYAPLVAMLFVYVCILISKLLIRRNYLLNTLLLGSRV